MKINLKLGAWILMLLLFINIVNAITLDELINDIKEERAKISAEEKKEEDAKTAADRAEKDKLGQEKKRQAEEAAKEAVINDNIGGAKLLLLAVGYTDTDATKKITAIKSEKINEESAKGAKDQKDIDKRYRKNLEYEAEQLIKSKDKDKIEIGKELLRQVGHDENKIAKKEQKLTAIKGAPWYQPKLWWLLIIIPLIYVGLSLKARSANPRRWFGRGGDSGPPTPPAGPPTVTAQANLLNSLIEDARAEDGGASSPQPVKWGERTEGQAKELLDQLTPQQASTILSNLRPAEARDLFYNLKDKQADDIYASIQSNTVVSRIFENYRTTYRIQRPNRIFDMLEQGEAQRILAELTPDEAKALLAKLPDTKAKEILNMIEGRRSI